MTVFALPLVTAAATLLPQVRPFWRVSEGTPLQPGQVKVSSHLVREGREIAVYQEDGYRFSTLGPEDEERQVAAAVQAFDDDIFPREVAIFGPCPDRDGNAKVILLLCPLPRSPALFFAFDAMDDADAVRYGFHSNQGEVLYHTFEEQGNRAGWNVQTLAESFHQLLHFARDPGETAWSALLANYTPYLCGLAPVRLLWGDFDPAGRLHSPSDPWGERGWSLLFLQYLRDRLGDEALRDLVARPEKGLAGVGSLLAARGDRAHAGDLLADFAMACWLDDPVLGDGRFAFKSVAPPRPRPAAHALASRPTSGAIDVGVGGMAFFLIESNGERSFPLMLQGDPTVRWVGRAVQLRRHGPDQELPVAFSTASVARVDLPKMEPGDQVVVAAVALPGDSPEFDRRTLLLRWGLAWAPRAPVDQGREMLNGLIKKALPAGGTVAQAHLMSTIERLAGGSPEGGEGPVVQTRYAWAPEARAVLEVLKQEAGRRGLPVREQTFLRRAPNEIEQDWVNLVIDLPGADPRRWPVVLAAHWDGARTNLRDSYLRALNLDDNASGVAVAMEAAAAMSRMPHRTPIQVAFLAGGYHEAAGANALLGQLGGVTAWVELDAVGAAQAWPRTADVYLEGKIRGSGFPFSINQAFRHCGLAPKAEEEIRAPHTGASIVVARGMPGLVISTRPPDAAGIDLDTPRAVERQSLSPELMVLVTKAVATVVTDLAGAP
ncbi:MAG TPA: M28 family peptidase [Thermoanaerobaculaceae bacterium]|nr:M28 family peptidase [Thermoanaerobaculaceae bacterium]